jgi:truncated hemoglobin YjbI
MNEIWVGIAAITAITVALIALGGAGWAVLRAHDMTGLFDNLVHVLRAKGILLAAATDSGPSSGSRENATPTGPQPVVGQTHQLPDQQLSAPPRRPDTARDWLTHYTGGKVTWPQVVREFYTAAAADPDVASYFAGVDMERLQKHFTAAITIVTREGVTAGTRAAMVRAHAGVINQRGMRITGDVYDKVITVLVDILTRHDVPSSAIGELARTVAPLRVAIVAEA